MIGQRLLLLPDLRLNDEGGHDKPFDAFLADFNILLIRRVPVSSHGPATELLRRLLSRKRGTKDVTVCGFDIRSPDCPCETCHGPHIVFQGSDLVTICDSDRSVYRQFGVVGDDRFFVIRSDRRVIDVGSIRDVDRLSTRLGLDASPSRYRITHAPPERHGVNLRQTDFNGRFRSRRASK
jgi:hypothetical protein